LAQAGKRRLAYGFWRYREGDLDAALAMLSAARESGIDHLDTADVYGGKGASERILGELRKRAPSLFAGAFLASKGGVEKGVPYNSSAASIGAACDGSLSRLGVERLDLYYVHRPDLLTHPAELAATLDGLVAAGKVGAIGVSNFSVAQISALSRYMKAPIVAHQLQFSASHFAPLFDGTLDLAMERDMAVAAWSPLAGGRLGEGGPPEYARVREALVTFAAKYGVAPAAIAFAYLHRHPAAVTPIVGSRTPERLREAVQGASIELTRADWYRILESGLGSAMP